MGIQGIHGYTGYSWVYTGIQGIGYVWVYMGIEGIHEYRGYT